MKTILDYNFLTQIPGFVEFLDVKSQVNCTGVGTSWNQIQFTKQFQCKKLEYLIPKEIIDAFGGLNNLHALPLLENGYEIKIIEKMLGDTAKLIKNLQCVAVNKFKMTDSIMRGEYEGCPFIAFKINVLIKDQNNPLVVHQDTTTITAFFKEKSDCSLFSKHCYALVLEPNIKPYFFEDLIDQSGKIAGGCGSNVYYDLTFSISEIAEFIQNKKLHNLGLNNKIDYSFELEQ